MSGLFLTKPAPCCAPPQRFGLIPAGCCIPHRPTESFPASPRNRHWNRDAPGVADRILDTDLVFDQLITHAVGALQGDRHHGVYSTMNSLLSLKHSICSHYQNA